MSASWNHAGAILICFCVRWCYSAQSQSLDRSRPNIVVILADDLGIGDVGCFGNDTIKTPHVDSICRDGAKLSHHVVAAPVCTPSRAALLTGRYPKRIGIIGDDSTKAFFRLPVNVWTASSAGLPEAEVTFAEVAKSAGYRTGIIGKWHLGLNCPGKPNCHNPVNQGFDYWWGFPLSNMKDFGDDVPLKWVGRQWKLSVGIIAVAVVIIATAIVEKKLGVIGSKMAGVFIFLGLSIFSLYFTLMSLKFWNSMILRNTEVVERPIELDSLSLRMAREAETFIAKSVAKRSATPSSSSPFLLFLSFAHTHTALHALPEHKKKSRHGAYGDAVEEMDWQVGQLLDSLKRHSALDNTLVYFSSDHGGHVEETTWGSVRAGGFNGRFVGGKFQTFEGGIRVPTAVMWPGVVRRGSQVEGLTSNMDVMATILDVLRVEGHPQKIDGKSLMPLFAADAATNEADATAAAVEVETPAAAAAAAAAAVVVSEAEVKVEETAWESAGEAAKEEVVVVDSAPQSGGEEGTKDAAPDEKITIEIEKEDVEKQKETTGENGESSAKQKYEHVPAENSSEGEASVAAPASAAPASAATASAAPGSAAPASVVLASAATASAAPAYVVAEAQSPPSEQVGGHSLLLHFCDFLLNSATYEPNGPKGDIWKDVDPPLLFDLASDPYEERPLPLTSDRLRLLDRVTKMARAKDAELRGATPQMTLSKTYLNPLLMPFCPEFPFLFCKDKIHRDTYLY